MRQGQRHPGPDEEEEEEELVFIIRTVPNHRCQLPHAICKNVDVYIAGFCQHFRRKFRQLMLVDSHDVMSRKIFYSTAGIEKEQLRHLRFHYYMIHPFSLGRKYWETLMLFVYLLVYVLVPTELLNGHVAPPLCLVILKFICDIICILDIVITFFTGVYCHNKRGFMAVELDRLYVYRNYILGYFLIDFTSSIPISLILYIWQPSYETWNLKWLMAVKLGRAFTVLKYLNNFCQRMSFYSYTIKAVSVSFVIVASIAWTSGIIRFNFTGAYFTTEDLKITEKIDIFYYVIAKLFLVGTRREHDEHELLYQNTMFLVGFILNLILIVEILFIYFKRLNLQNRHDNFIQQMEEFVTYKELPTYVTRKILRYLNFRYQKNIYDEEKLLTSFSPILRRDIMMLRCQQLIEKVEFFHDIPQSLIMGIASHLQQQFYLPEDVIVEAGRIGNSMYFIYIGTVAIIAPNGKEICHLEDGSHFGEVSLVFNERRTASVIAVTECEVYRLSRRAFLEATEDYPEISNKIRRSALNVVEQSHTHIIAD